MSSSLTIRHSYLLFLASYFFISSCSVSKQINRSANEDVLSNKALAAAHVGISIYEPAANKYWFNYQGDKYFVPASNTKLPTCYAAMKYLGDSLVGLRYEVIQNPIDTGIFIEPSGDPTFLHPDFKTQRVFEFLKTTQYKIGLSTPIFSHISYARGWQISDINESYMPPRSNWPIYGNIAKFKIGINYNNVEVVPGYISKKELIAEYGDPTGKTSTTNIIRYDDDNHFLIMLGNDLNKRTFYQEVPLSLKNDFPVHLIEDTLGKSIYNFCRGHRGLPCSEARIYYMSPEISEYLDDPMYKLKKASIIHSQPTDSLLKPMMHRSDNFFAEQSLLMVSNERLGVMNDEKIIDTLLKTDFKDLPQKPRWVDGSGLSRYNLFTPQDFVAILNKMKNEFGMERIKVILPTGGEGTISSYYKADSGFIYGKTGTLSGVVAFSGFLYTKKGKLLIFSTLVNNHQASATEVRRAMEKFLEGIRNNY